VFTDRCAASQPVLSFLWAIDTEFNKECPMETCKVLTREMLKSPMDLTIKDPHLDFTQAKTAADARSREECNDPMLLAWYDRKSGEYSPRVECCHEKKPGWLVYAESRGADIVIDIKREDFVFIYKAFQDYKKGV
jgi:hypothetical protein